jgi:hypothetical protein
MVKAGGTYFGIPDAAHEDGANILYDHVFRDFEPNIKAADRAEGCQVVVGIKGSGKTALRRYIEEKDGTAIRWNIDADHRYLAIDPSLGGRSGILKNTLALEILRAFSSHLADNARSLGLPEQRAAGLRSVADKVVERLKRIPNAITVEAGPVAVDLAALLKSGAAPVVDTAWPEAQQGVLAALGNRRAYIMIDDADDVFPGLEKNPVFVEGLARAVHDINRASKERLHVLLFLKHGVWRRWFENQQEYDRVEHVIQHLSWDHDGLCDLVARRVARLQGKDPEHGSDVQSLWSLEFDWKSRSFDEFARSFTDLCVSGPRDMIVLGNRAKDAAGSSKIRLEHLQSRIDKYSESKLYEIGADFGGVYPDIVRFVENVFQRCPEEMSGADAAAWIEKYGLTAKKVDDYFREYPWYATASKERMVALMYEIGFWGVRRSNSEVVFSIQRPSMSTTEIIGASVVVHPAFRPHLTSGTKVSSSSIKRKKQV